MRSGTPSAETSNYPRVALSPKLTLKAPSAAAASAGRPQTHAAANTMPAGGYSGTA